MLARLPLLHPDGLVGFADLGPADALKRAVRRRVKLVEDHRACLNRLDAMLDLLGPGYAAVLGTRGAKTALAVLERFGDPRALRRSGLTRVTAFVRSVSGGKWNEEHAERLLEAANEAIALWRGGGLAFTELAWDLASEVRIIRQLDTEIDRLDERIAELYANADPKKIIQSAPGVGPVLAAGIRGRLGDANRFANLAAVRSFSGMIPDRARPADRRSPKRFAGVFGAIDEWPTESGGRTSTRRAAADVSDFGAPVRRVACGVVEAALCRLRSSGLCVVWLTGETREWLFPEGVVDGLLRGQSAPGGPGVGERVVAEGRARVGNGVGWSGPLERDDADSEVFAHCVAGAEEQGSALRVSSCEGDAGEPGKARRDPGSRPVEFV
jgi:hypothetical protein